MYKTIHQCRACGSDQLLEILDFGLVPLANDFKLPSTLGIKGRVVESEWMAGFYPLTLMHCQDCWLGQLKQVVAPDVLYPVYPYTTSRSRTMAGHFANLKLDILNAHGGQDALRYVVEIGSNDGFFLKQFVTEDGEVRGVDPSTNLAAQAEKEGVPTICRFFDYEATDHVLTKGVPSLVIARHVMCHIDNWAVFRQCLRAISDENTLIVIEVPYAGDMIKNDYFDTIYHEHLSYMTMNGMSEFLRGSDFFLQGVKHYEIHGGSVVFFIRRKRKGTTNPIPNEIMSERLNFDRWVQFARRAQLRIRRFRDKVNGLTQQGHRIAGYGAPAKSTVWINACRFTSKQIKCLYDNTDFKVFRNSPGTDIPIRPPEMLYDDNPSHLILFAWNYGPEIMNKEKRFVDQGGIFLNPIEPYEP